MAPAGTPESTGGTKSTSTIVCEQNAVLLHESMAFHVRVALKVAPHSGFVTVFTTLMSTFVPSQLSLAVGASNCQFVPHATVRSGWQTTTGGVRSTTVTTWLHVARLVH